nr:MAG TPA: hypothetical protein [Caudoviricetes sp.]
MKETSLSQLVSAVFSYSPPTVFISKYLFIITYHF